MMEKPSELSPFFSLFIVNSIQFFHDSLSSLSSHPLFSTIVALYTLILLLTPSLFLRILLSPIFNLTGFLLLFLLKLGVEERSENKSNSIESRVFDSDRCLKQSSFETPIEEQDKICLYLGLSSEPVSIESRNLDSIGGPKRLGPESNIDDTRFLDPMDQNQNWVSETDPKPNSTESKSFDSVDQNHKRVLESKPDLASESDSMESIKQGEEVIDSQDEYHKWVSPISLEEEEDQKAESDSEEIVKTGPGIGSGRPRFYEDSFLEWNTRAPLGIIYEEEEDCQRNDGVSGLENYPSLSMYYPESDTDSSSDGEFPVIEKWDSLEKTFFEWEEEKDELIEIALDRYAKKKIEFYHVEEDNLIEIDIFRRETEFSGEKRFSDEAKGCR